MIAETWTVQIKRNAVTVVTTAYERIMGIRFHNVICFMPNYVHNLNTKGKIISDAYKIAAAPEMLIALELLIDRCKTLDQSATDDGLLNCEAIANARAVIRKAKNLEG